VTEFPKARLTSETNQRSSSHSAMPSPVCAKGTSTSTAASPAAAGAGAAEASLPNHLLTSPARRPCNSHSQNACGASAEKAGAPTTGRCSAGGLTSPRRSRANDASAGDPSWRRRRSSGEEDAGLTSGGGCEAGGEARGGVPTAGRSRSRRPEREREARQAEAIG
jgi:hypothetical protein